MAIRIKNIKDYKAFDKKLREKSVNMVSVNKYAQGHSGFDGVYVLGFAKIDYDLIEEGIGIILDEINKF